MLRHLAFTLALGCATIGPIAGAGAQAQPPKPGTPPTVAAAATPSADSVAAMMPFARVHAALTALRERADAEYADPKNKKPEVLSELREKFRGQRAQILKAQGLTETSYGQFTKRISSDDAARLAFEAALAKVSAK